MVVPSAQYALRQSPAFPDQLLPILPPWLTCHVTSLARPSLVPECCCTLPGSHDTFLHCCYLFGPSPPTGPRSSMRDCVLSIWLPGVGKPLIIPRHLSDSQQRGSANEHPGWVLRRVGGHEESRRKLPFIGSVSSFIPYRHTPVCPCLALSMPGRVLTALPAFLCSFCILQKAYLLSCFKSHFVTHSPLPAVQGPCTTFGCLTPATLADHSLQSIQVPVRCWALGTR